MKQQDIALIIVVIFVAAGLSFAVTKMVFTPEDSKRLQVETVTPINAEFRQPDKAVFNENAINPTQLIQIGDGNNSSQF